MNIIKGEGVVTKKKKGEGDKEKKEKSFHLTLKPVTLLATSIYKS
jgi:hypothetical protein